METTQQTQSEFEANAGNLRQAREYASEQVAIHHTEKNGTCAFYHNTLQT